MTLDDPKYDDTRPEYYEAWKNGEHPSPGLVPNSFNIVDLPKDRWPNFKEWGWSVFLSQIWDFNGDYPEYRVGDLRRMFTYGEDRLWLWDHNGAGDFVRISSQRNNDRLIVVFDHESGRSPWAKGEDGGYAPGLDFLQPIDLGEIFQSDTHPFSDKLAAMTEAYRYRYSTYHDFGPELKKYIEDPRLMEDRCITSPEVMAEGNSFSVKDRLEEFGPVTEGERKWTKPEAIERRPRFVQLKEDLLAGNLPTLTEMRDLLDHDLVAAVAFDVMYRIADHWIPSPNEQHERWLKQSKSKS